MEGNRRIAIVVGAFVLAGLAALALTILSLSSQQGVFRDRYRLVAYFENVQGLLANAPVWLAGRQVGRVESVGFSPPGSGRPALRVILQIDLDVRREDECRADVVSGPHELFESPPQDRFGFRLVDQFELGRSHHTVLPLVSLLAHS